MWHAQPCSFLLITPHHCLDPCHTHIYRCANHCHTNSHRSGSHRDGRPGYRHYCTASAAAHNQ
ncbi:hypothetical protein GCM10027395_19640 [Giesbergeria sinuosa]